VGLPLVPWGPGCWRGWLGRREGGILGAHVAPSTVNGKSPLDPASAARRPVSESIGGAVTSPAATTDQDTDLRLGASAVDDPPRWLLLGLVLAAVGATLFAFATLGSKPVGIDEAYTALAARLGWGVLVHIERFNSDGMFAYYSLEKVLPLGSSPADLRLPSAVIALTIGPLTAVAGRRLLGWRWAVAAGCLVAIHPMIIEYFQDARSYTPLVAASLVITILLQRACERGGKWWLVYGVCAGAALYTHLFLIFVLAAHVVVIGATWRRGIQRAGLSLGIAACAIVASPVALTVLQSRSTTGAEASFPSVHTVAGAGWRASGRGTPVLAALEVVLVVVACVALARRWSQPGVRRWGRRTRPRHAAHGRGDRTSERGVAPAEQLEPSAPGGATTLIVWPALLVVPGLTALIISPIQPVFTERYLIVSVPALVILMLEGIRQIRRATLRKGVVVLVAGLFFLGQTTWYRGAETEDWPSATSYVAGAARPGDGIVFVAPFGRLGFEYQLVVRRGQSPVLRPLLPSHPWGQPLTENDTTASDVQALPAAVKSVQRVWLVINRPLGDQKQVTPDLARDDFAQGGMRLRSVRTFNMIVVELWAPPSPT
jgi:mannosyltransferase